MPTSLPLCIDLDGTLIKGDLSFESLLLTLRRRPTLALRMPFWLLRGRAFLKARLAEHGAPETRTLPYNPAVLEIITEARRLGRETVLVTGSHRSLAERVATDLNLFDRILATDERINLTGRAKADLLTATFGELGFEYAGNEPRDLPVWEKSAGIVVIGADASLMRRASALGKPIRQITEKSHFLRNTFKAMRPHQWAKNFLVFVPLITSHRILDGTALTAVIIAFAAFSLTASGTYILNDLLDIDADRSHSSKNRRPFASGALSIPFGLALSMALTLGGLVLAWTLLSQSFFSTLVLYSMLTLFYSIKLKRIASLDVIVLASLYTLRIVGGAVAANVELSSWLLAFSTFMFLSLAFVKRTTELQELRDNAGSGQDRGNRAKGREYSTEDIPLLQMLGVTSGYMSVLLFALYIDSGNVKSLYATPELLWLVAPLLLLWVTRLWINTSRGYVHEDPIVYAITDPETWAVAILTVVILAVATRYAVFQ